MSVMSGIHDNQCYIDNQLVQVTRADKLMELEWQHHLMNFAPNGLEPELFLTKELPIANNTENSLPADKTSETAYENNTNITAKQQLPTEFQKILKAVEIPDEDINQDILLMEKIKNSLRAEHPSIEIVMYRHRYLKLRTTGSDVLYLFVYEKEDKDGRGYSVMSVEPLNEAILEHSDIDSSNDGKKLREYGSNFVVRPTSLSSQSQLKFHCAHHPTVMSEVQMCKLVKYFCQFDARIKPLFAILFYWGRLNQIYFGDISCKAARNMAHISTPEPAAFEWLVILFLIKNKIIPSPREVQRQPHKPILLTDDRVDIGFAENPVFVKEWQGAHDNATIYDVTSPDFILGLLQLARQFFVFCQRIGNLPYILNMRDGEIIQRKKFLDAKNIHSILGRDWNTQLTPEEILAVRSNVILKPTKIFIIHPLIVAFRLSISSTSFKSIKMLMSLTASNLAKDIPKIKNKTLRYSIKKILKVTPVVKS